MSWRNDKAMTLHMNGLGLDPRRGKNFVFSLVVVVIVVVVVVVVVLVVVVVV